ncbi:MAG: hypothetical protein HKL90_08110 [Elusimicrobia bacterium]|nr:hypothetical protein [Elusimicrobiota bacterium]
MSDASRARRLELLEVLTVGLPFCGFKVLTGLTFASAQSPVVRLLAAALIGLGGLDAMINVASLAGLAFAEGRPTDACVFALATRPLRRPPRSPRAWQDFGNSLDILLSFALVALMIGGGLLRGMPADRLTVWNACVILNVLGAGLGRFDESLRNLSRASASLE